MTRLSVFIASSTDGFIADDDGKLDWLESRAHPDEDYGWDHFMESIDGLAMGRATYDFISHIDPLPFGERHLYVFTSNPPEPRDGVTFWSPTPTEALAAWNDAGLERVYVDGGQLISSFLAEGLIDDMLLTKAPVMLGSGKPLFHPEIIGAQAVNLRLHGVESFDKSGFVNLSYTRV